ncbi:prephenate dehydratase [Psychrobium sp. MM17-31]|uniref:prephenate dehydratase n=1 Tax=Psychrobium sp. MM17-31 TaxID=2917758 RepID=UPI001EF53EAD|nr:prephenate dehydratase [Psychrobium sp. MM17-31]MCG7533285.1 prephenate dehydratase [Psychrobium sp. MM17-31]
MSDKVVLSEVREKITALDQQLLTLLGERRQLSLSVAQSKIDTVKAVRDTEREEQLLIDLIQRGHKLGLDAHYVSKLFHVIIEDSVLNQQAWLQERANHQHESPIARVAFLGSKGSYSYLACHRYFSRRVEDIIELGCDSFSDIVTKVESGQAEFGLLPIENTSSGSINEVYDVLQHTSLSIVGELTQPVEHCLVTADNSSIEHIDTVYCHVQPYQQCSQFLSKHKGIKFEFVESTAAAMEQVATLNTPNVAAIASQEGGKLYGLNAIERNIANQQENHSRFIVVARKAVEVAVQIPAKTTFIMSTHQTTGALVDALLVLKNNGISMTKLESRPIQGNPWEEMFYIDVDCNLHHASMQQALNELNSIAKDIKILGCYPSETIQATPIPDVLLDSNTPV